MPELRLLIDQLRRHFGEPEVPPARGPFELVMWENACYLMPDERRAAVFLGLRQHVGMTPESIWKADKDVLMPLARMGGMRPETRVLRWREIARIVLTQFGGDLDSILKQSYAAAKKALKLFPTIGDPAAEKILLFCGAAGASLPLESNGLRVLTRFDFGRQQKSYSATYRSVQEAIGPQLPRNAKALAAAHLLLREHGKTFCKTNGPLCHECPVEPICARVL